MPKTKINETPRDGSNPIQVQIVTASRRQIETAMRKLNVGRPVEVAVGWTHVASEVIQKLPRPYVWRLPVLEREGRVRYLKVEEIDWIEAERQYVRLHVRAKTFLARGQAMTIKDLASRLDPQHFMRVHRSHIVNLERVEVLGTGDPAKRYAVLTRGHSVPVSQAYWEQLRTALGAGWE